jgi:molybdopterin-guanine dinucleotide biosynthesis protein A
MAKDLTSSIAAIILAGGQSSRMGRDKALIQLGEKPLLSQICTLAGECASHVYVVTPWIERYRDILPQNCQLIPEVPLFSESKPHGPLIGFFQGLQKIDSEWILLLACDLPRLSASEVKQWCECLPQVSPNAIAFLPRHPKGWEPLCGFYRRRCLPLLKAYIDSGGRSFQGWLAQHPVEELPVSDRQMLFNCNTPEDLEQLKSKN